MKPSAADDYIPLCVGEGFHRLGDFGPWRVFGQGRDRGKG